MKAPVGLLIACLVVGACAITGGVGASASPGAPIDLAGRVFLSTRATNSDAERQLVPGTRVRLSFDAGSLSASAGCNTIGADYVVAGGRLRTAQIATTEIGCGAELQAQHEWLIALLGSGPHVSLDGQQLVLDSGTSTLVMLDRIVAEPDLPLVGTEWVLDSIIDGQSVSSVPQGVGATIRFADDGTFSITPGCNTGGGHYHVEGDTMTFSQIVLTEMACQGPPADVESAVLAVVTSRAAAGFEIHADQLTLTGGIRALQFTVQ